MKPKMKLTAPTLRIILLITLGLTLAVGAFGFYMLRQVMSDYAKETSSLNSQASASDQNIQSLQKLQAYLDSHKSEISKVNQVVADSKEYQYQNDIINDLTAFANQSGVSITSFTFTSTAAGSSGTSTPAPAAAGAATKPTTDAAPAASALKSTTVSVAITNPVDYNNLLAFINHIEQNLTKMQVSSVNLTHDPGKGKNEVSSDVFNIEVYVR